MSFAYFVSKRTMGYVLKKEGQPAWRPYVNVIRTH